MRKKRNQLPRPDRARRRSDLDYLWFGKGRARLVALCKNMGIRDICECDDRDWNSATTSDPRNPDWRIRPNSGPVGMKECTACRCLLWPLSYVFDCDNCTEPTLANKYPVTLDEEFLCFDCQIDEMESKHD